MTTGDAIRPPAVAGLFYPDDADELHTLLQNLLAGNPATGPAPKALIAPHAGYVYSGPIAARAYNCLAPGANTVRRVVLMGPAHRVAVRGLALPDVDAFRTPLGDTPLDQEAIALIESLPQVEQSGAAHRLEHSLEVHLPFLQTLLGSFTLVPLVVGWAQPQEIAQVLETLWGGTETLVVISSDLSHYHPYDTARRLDEETAQQIEARQIPIRDLQACGAYPINGLLTIAQKRNMIIQRLDLRNSGDTAGDRQHVVGYGAWTLYDH
ncbi:MAG: AmmeMemoRadiSam system protein B [Gammaproteobacteria bacterium]